MKTGQIEDILKNRGMERGTLYVLQAQQEQIVTLTRSVKEMEQLMLVMCDTMQNVVHGAAGMKDQMVSAMRKAGLSGVGVDSEDLGHNTQGI